MSRQVKDDYVRVPLPNNLEINDGSDSELDGVMEQPVLRRLAFSVLPNPRSNFTQKVLKPRADLYGPFWIATTLILASAVGSNVSNFLKSRGQSSSWRYDFGKVTLASTVIYMYWWLVPLAIVALSYIRLGKAGNSQDEDQDPLVESRSRVNRRGLDKSGFVELLSLYGYSLTIFVPVSILWTIPSIALQWLLVMAAMGISGAFLAFALFPIFRRDHKKLAGLLVFGLIVLHCIFSIGFMITFFYGSVTPSTIPTAAESVAASIDLAANNGQKQEPNAPPIVEQKRDVESVEAKKPPLIEQGKLPLQKQKPD